MEGGAGLCIAYSNTMHFSANVIAIISLRPQHACGLPRTIAICISWLYKPRPISLDHTQVNFRDPPSMKDGKVNGWQSAVHKPCTMWGVWKSCVGKNLPRVRFFCHVEVSFFSDIL